MKQSAQYLRIIAHSQTALLKVQARRAIRSLIFLSLGLCFALLALLVLNIAGFIALEEMLGALVAGLSVGFVDLLLAGILLRIALKTEPESSEEKLAREVSALSLASLEKDMSGIRKEVHQFTSDVGRLRSAITFITSGLTGPLQFLLDLLVRGNRSDEKLDPQSDEIESSPESN